MTVKSQRVWEKLTCSQCGKTKSEKEFYHMPHSNERCDICKTCLTRHVDNQDPQTFLWILEKFDIPYIEDIWIEMSNKAYMKNPAKFGPLSVIGKYMRSMKINPYKDYHYSDSDRLNFEVKKQKQDREAENMIRWQSQEPLRQEMKKKFENGEITQAEYETIVTPPPTVQTAKPAFVRPVEISEDDIRGELDEDDMRYLALKWGITYKPSEWVRMEELYLKYANEYELNIDRETTLRTICKMQLKLDQALDIGDMNSVKSLSSSLDQMRKSAKFTEAQNKEKEEKYLDSIGELVAYCEQKGGIIEQFPDPEEYPQDKIDLTIKDLKAYNYNLATNELGLSDLIESYIEKLEKAQNEKDQELGEDLALSEDDFVDQELTDDEYMDFFDYQGGEVEKDAADMLALIESGML